MPLFKKYNIHPMKQLFRKLHLWLSVPFGIIITLICFSGAMLVFEDEVSQWFNPSLYRVEKVGDAPLPVEQLAARAAATLPEGVEVQGVTIFPDPERACQVSLSKPRRAALFIDQYTGEVKGRSERLPFFTTMFSLHRWLLGSRPDDGGIFWGKIIVGTSTLLFVIVLISGVVIWWPRSIKGLRNSLKLKIRNSRLWHSLHVAGGMYVLLLLLVMALTGLTWSFGWYRTGFYKAFGVELQQNGGSGSRGGGNGNHANGGNHSGRSGNHRGGKPQTDDKFLHWQKVYETLAASNPDNISITISSGSATVANNHFGNTRGSDRYKFDARTGEITESNAYADLPKSGKIRGWIFSTHTGSFGGIATRILWFLAALLGATLPITGYYLWIKRLVKHKH